MGVRPLLTAPASVAALAMAHASVGCFPQFGDYSEAGGGPSDGASTSTGAEGGGGAEPCIVPESEDCTNGKDDDCDGKTDCADEDCSAFRCIPKDAFSEGPYWLSIADPADAPACPGNAIEAFDAVEIVDAPASCTCAVAAASGAVCNAATFHVYGSPGCMDTGTMFTATAACTNTSPFGHSAISATFTPDPNGACAAVTPALSVSPATVQHRRTCDAGRGGGCEAGEVCVASPPADAFEQVWCVAKEGEHPIDDCPASYSNAAYVVGDEPLEDRRACPACDYGPADSGCGALLYYYQGGNCMTALGAVMADGACADSTTQFASFQLTNVTTTQGSCAPLDASPSPTGTLGPGNPKTLCCSDPL